MRSGKQAGQFFVVASKERKEKQAKILVFFQENRENEQKKNTVFLSIMLSF